MSDMSDNLQLKIKNSSVQMVFVFFKLLVGLVYGVVLATIGQQIFAYEELSYLFVTLVVAGAFFKIAKTWTPLTLAVVTLVSVLVAVLLRMYILLAPGA